MRGAILGLGSIGTRHIANVIEIDPDVEFVVVGSRPLVPEANKHVVRRVDRIAEALRFNPDYVLVTSSSAHHIDALPSILRDGRPVYVEKPVVTGRRDMETIIELIDSVRYVAPSMAGCNLRFLPSLQAMRRAVLTQIGRPVRGHFEAGQWLPDWRPTRDYRTTYSAHPEEGGGVVLDLIHELDAARWLLGEFDRVQGDVGHRSGLEIASEDVAIATLSRRGGPAVSVALDYVSRVPVRRYHVVGEEGSVDWDLTTRTARLIRNEGITDLAGRSDFDIPHTYRTAMREFMAAVRTGKSTSQPLSEGLKSLDLALRVKGGGSRR